MKEKKDPNSKFWSRLSYFNLRQLGVALIIGNVLYFLYNIYFHHDVSHYREMHKQRDSDIQLIK